MDIFDPMWQEFFRSDKEKQIRTLYLYVELVFQGVCKPLPPGIKYWIFPWKCCQQELLFPPRQEIQYYPVHWNPYCDCHICLYRVITWLMENDNYEEIFAEAMEMVLVKKTMLSKADVSQVIKTLHKSFLVG